MPLAAPVTMAILPSSEPMSCLQEGLDDRDQPSRILDVDGVPAVRDGLKPPVLQRPGDPCPHLVAHGGAAGGPHEQRGLGDRPQLVPVVLRPELPLPQEEGIDLALEAAARAWAVGPVDEIDEG